MWRRLQARDDRVEEEHDGPGEDQRRPDHSEHVRDQPEQGRRARDPHTAQPTAPALRIRSTIEAEGTGGPSAGRRHRAVSAEQRRDDVGGDPRDARERVAAGPLLTEPLDQGHRFDAIRCRVVDLTGDRDDGHAEAFGQRRHAAHHLALEALLVEEALAGDHEVGALEALVEAHLVGDEVEPAHQLATDRRQPTAEPTGGAGARERDDVDAVLLEVHLREPLEATTQQLHLRRCRALLGREDRGRVEEPARGCRRPPPARCPSAGRAGAGHEARPAHRRWWPIHPARR